MHEYHFVEKITRQAEETAKSHHARKVKNVVFAVGEGLGFAEESIHMYFEQITQGTILDGATLTIRVKPFWLLCESCRISFPKQKSKFSCGRCGSEGKLSEGGKEFFIESLEIEE